MSLSRIGWWIWNCKFSLEKINPAKVCSLTKQWRYLQKSRAINHFRFKTGPNMFFFVLIFSAFDVPEEARQSFGETNFSQVCPRWVPCLPSYTANAHWTAASFFAKLINHHQAIHWPTRGHLPKQNIQNFWREKKTGKVVGNFQEPFSSKKKNLSVFGCLKKVECSVPHCLTTTCGK